MVGDARHRQDACATMNKDDFLLTRAAERIRSGSPDLKSDGLLYLIESDQRYILSNCYSTIISEFGITIIFVAFFFRFHITKVLKRRILIKISSLSWHRHLACDSIVLPVTPNSIAPRFQFVSLSKLS